MNQSLAAPFGIIAWQQRAKPVALKHCVFYVPADDKASLLLQNIITQCLHPHTRVTIFDNLTALETVKADRLISFGLNLDTTPQLSALSPFIAPTLNTLQSSVAEKRKLYQHLRSIISSA